ncbi:glyoxalase family protein [Grosmannia clavigera kw1407]|uniref:Glyoxalase family protein n=1 Tax=Grosmannia clavigera (strain kw1407 / UAMH 11150) TaxID=655863 RepID=F0XNS4_GROCL|nr:glyoxalase family protein [Grosmannia clavigera kw1407]EFX00207.1 glyoxalase family protein [Grosmannia clavigera kw1407]
MSPTLDHIVILVPRPQLHALPSWVTDSFTVIDGGQHAGGVTENKLILLQDGIYLELIAFVSKGNGEGDSGRRSHRWGAQPEGRIIDWALSLAMSFEEADEEFKQIQDCVRAADVGFVYQDLVAGGRTTPDGVVLEWATASPAAISRGSKGPESDLSGGLLPFWCLDRTERKLRVPYASAGGSLARHPSAAIGVAEVTIYVADSVLLDRLRRVYDAILHKTAEFEWDLAIPDKPQHRLSPRLRLVLLAKETVSEKDLEYGQRIELSLFTTSESRTVGGQFVDGWYIEVRLEKAQYGGEIA